jgi:amino acid permease
MSETPEPAIVASTAPEKMDEKIASKFDSVDKSDKFSHDHEKQGHDDDVVATPHLQRRLKSRHLQMIAIGMSTKVSHASWH